MIAARNGMKAQIGLKKDWQGHQIQQAQMDMKTSRAISTQLVHQPMSNRCLCVQPYSRARGAVNLL